MAESIIYAKANILYIQLMQKIELARSENPDRCIKITMLNLRDF